MTKQVDILRAESHLRSKLSGQPRVSVVLGSGLGPLVDDLSDVSSVDFEDVPGLPPCGVAGHAGRFVAGRLSGRDVLFQCGRYHFYEGHPADIVAAPVRVAARLGIRAIIFTNAAGGIHRELEAGDIVLLDDHINAQFRSPLVGPARRGEVRFPDMTAPYDAGLRQVARESAAELGIHLARGTYAAVLGPAYETASEVRMLGRLGADMVGMSTVPEVLVARALGLRCLAFSVVTNKAAGRGGGPLSHEEVLTVGRDAGSRLARLLTLVIPRVCDDVQSVSTK